MRKTTEGVIQNEYMEKDISVFTDGRAEAYVYSAELTCRIVCDWLRLAGMQKQASDHLLECRMHGRNFLIALDNQLGIKSIKQVP